MLHLIVLNKLPEILKSQPSIFVACSTSDLEESKAVLAYLSG